MHICLLIVRYMISYTSRASAGEAGEWDSDVGVAQDETHVEIGQPQEGLYVFNVVGLRPILNDLYLINCHGKSVWREDIT